MLNENQFPIDIIKAAREKFQRCSADLNSHVILNKEKEAYMIGMLNERLSSQTKLAEEAFDAARKTNNSGLSVNLDFLLYKSFKEWLYDYQK